MTRAVASRLALVLVVIAGLVWALPAHAGPGYPAPTVTITSSPGPLGVRVSSSLTAEWEIYEPGRAATLWIEGDVFTATTLVAVWTSKPHDIPHNSDIGGISARWEVSEPPVGAQSRQEMAGRITRVGGGWDAWRPEAIQDPYITDTGVFDETGVHVHYQMYRGARLPHGQTQYRLVLHLEPFTRVVEQSWNVGY
jgi:hypothetical protein